MKKKEFITEHNCQTSSLRLDGRPQFDFMYLDLKN